MKLIILSGSFRKQSYSLRIAQSLKLQFPEHTFLLPALDKLAFYSNDLENNKPDNVQQLLQQIAACQGLICITPEYNHSIPAVLKNAIDWASRTAFASVLKNKPCAIISQAQSPVGGARAQAHLKNVLDSTLSSIYPNHEMLLTPIASLCNENQVVDEKSKQRLQSYVQGFIDYCQQAVPKLL